MLFIFLVFIAYVIGSIPFGYIIGKLFNIDVTKTGSGNIGATNVARSLGFNFGLIVFVLDLLKGTFAILIALQITQEPSTVILVGLSAILGHMFSIFLKFKGGKGSAVGLGILLGIAPDVFFFTFLFVVFVMLTTRYVSVSSILGVLCTVILMILFQKPTPYVWVSILMLILSIIKHRSNIQRLMQGTERKIGEKL
ncbi:acyl-phosphate glycerol 3-phosphate acyltransferase [candidate division WOR-1 bacterium RIFOXYC2_FULL_37_10]|uniref:Glycerol-3-phosphate acyltransferase n=1 Tax=candidate division WOR-1 bacterium RIFOXYB2_FULL_37_13 TaxID=1802579 RepID=A0A1F4SP66_UNCSA|nr:MAG: acyl-phosphate glycerol 3-phosphate acyltransferase [candidate division WOR-1 bacterium RIFOXYB2_FULL_37_13]OGC34534.1 MAG: acyl-phosphate glycerol 3-phosphate acyltransferase [candidate division WOR-1 bacterium RIFOXYC2_FULL_37_10]